MCNSVTVGISGYIRADSPDFHEHSVADFTKFQLETGPTSASNG